MANIFTNYYENFLVLSMCIKINQQEVIIKADADCTVPTLCSNDVTFPYDSVKKSLSAVCSQMGIHNVARVRHGILPLFEVDFVQLKELHKFCSSLNGTTLCSDSCYVCYVY